PLPAEGTAPPAPAPPQAPAAMPVEPAVHQELANPASQAVANETGPISADLAAALDAAASQ
ncbi:MAG TPA: hypothetical protein VF175_09915, partial [Lacipirellula sp.]